MEWRILVGSLLGAWGWWAGGRGLRPGKAWRRVVLPVALGILVGGLLPLWRTLVGVGLMMLANSMGYGEKAPLWKKLCTTLFLGVCLLPFGLAWWQAALMPMWFGGNYLFSRWHNQHSWAFVEATTGAIQGGLVGMAQ